MKTGPNRRIVTSDVYLLHDEELPPLGRLQGVDFSQRPETERDVLDVHRQYRSQLQEEHWASDLDTIEKRVARVLSASEALSAAVRDFQCLDDDARSRLEFKAAINGVLPPEDLQALGLPCEVGAVA
jgi:hypothetical protein